MGDFSASVRGRIPVLRTSGSGATPLSAFHRALAAVGLGHYNLVHLSSVVPPRARVDGTGTAALPAGHWGDRMYCVYAVQSATTPGEQAWAGLGWIERADGLGGFFVEHMGSSEAAVVAEIRASLEDLGLHGGERYGDPQWAVHGVECTGDPVCALVIAPFASEPWGRAGAL
ncbi:MAG: putative pyruvoyl-dependent arginine decarboxylase [Actinomycetia bacterium]|jgi:arginine decarboxylase|nr:putative pyruvoyl-dependent arginine decarboxylase [Actinomycetes bacterium]